MSYSHFTLSKRIELSILLKKGYSQRDLAEALEINHSSISREIKRNSVQGAYVPDKANHKAYLKRHYSKYQGMKIRDDSALEKYVIAKLKLHWSPEEISGRIKKIDKHIQYVSPVGIYKYLYSVWGQSLCRLLYSKRHKRRRRKSQKKSRRQLIPNRVSIDARPEIINLRQRVGDWELDTLGAIKSDKARVAGAVDRRSRFFQAAKIPGLKYTMPAFKNFLNPRKHIVYSGTFDNGIENVRHKELNVPTYFCDPYSSWQKGSVENTFLRLRRFIPKKQSLGNFSDRDIASFVEIMNNTPRKCLGFRTPFEVYSQQLIIHKCCT